MDRMQFVAVRKTSIEVTERPATSMANVMQDTTGTPSSRTVHAEHAPQLHAIWVPVRPSGPRNASASVVHGGTATVRLAPLIRRDIATTSGSTMGVLVFGPAFARPAT